MTDGSFAEKGRPAAGRKHRRRAIGGLRRLGRNRPGVAAPGKYALHRHQDIQQGFLPGFRTPARLDRVDRLVGGRDQIGACQALPEAPCQAP